MLAKLHTERTDLQQTRLGNAYQRRLHVGFLALQAWLSSLVPPVSMDQAFATPISANKYLVRFVQAAFETSAPFWVAKHAILFVQTAQRELKGQLRTSWDSIASWDARRPHKNRVPCPLLL